MRTERDMMKAIDGVLAEQGIERTADGRLHLAAGEGGSDDTGTPAAPETYAFPETLFDTATLKSGTGGFGRLVMIFKGHGDDSFRATFGSGEVAPKADSAVWTIDELRFEPVAMAPAGTTGDPTADLPRKRDPIVIRNKSLSARVSSTGVTVNENETEVSIKVEMSVSRGGGAEGMVRDGSGSPSDDRFVLTPDMHEAIGRVTSLQGILTLVRAAQAAQGDLFAAPAYVDPFPAPEGVKETTLHRGKRPAVKAFESAVSATNAEGLSVEVAAVREQFDADPGCILRTWKDAPIAKVCRDGKTLYVLNLPAESAGAEGAGQGATGGGGTGE